MRTVIASLPAIFSLLGIIYGFVLFLKPSLAIEAQRKFYVLINWKLEPVSMPKEIRNTVLMGAGEVIFCLVTFYLTFLTYQPQR